MKTIIAAILSLIVGLAGGTFYGWQTGYVDGQIVLQATNFALIEKYASIHDPLDLAKRDKVVDFLAVGCGVTFAKGADYSPMNRFTQPKADCGLLGVAAFWELNSRKPILWTADGKQPALFRAGTPEAVRLERLKAANPDYYQRELQKQEESRHLLAPGKA